MITVHIYTSGRMAMSDCAEINIRIWHLWRKFIITIDALVEIGMRVESCQIILSVVHVIANYLTLWLSVIIAIDRHDCCKKFFCDLYQFWTCFRRNFLSLILFSRRCFKWYHIDTALQGSKMCVKMAGLCLKCLYGRKLKL